MKSHWIRVGPKSIDSVPLTAEIPRGGHLKRGRDQREAIQSQGVPGAIREAGKCQEGFFPKGSGRSGAQLTL
jgi:hypothetical protein